ncbi:MAG: protein translocase subunit SecD [Hyphomicrobiales bacterium]
MLYFSRWKIALIVAVVGFGALLAAPNVLPANFRAALSGWLPSDTVNLGLDLKGGSYLLLEVDRKDLVAHLAKQLQGDVRQILRKNHIGYVDLKRGTQGVSVRIRNASDVEKALDAIKGLAEPISPRGIGPLAGERDVDVCSDGRMITLQFTAKGVDAKISGAVEQAIEVIRRRIDALGTTEPTIRRQGTNRIVVQVPGFQEPERLKELLSATAKLQFRLLCRDQPKSAKPRRAPPGCELLYSRDPAGRPYFVQTASSAGVDGEDLVLARPDFAGRTNEPVVTFLFNQHGAMRFGRLTQANVGRRFAIILDNSVISAPVIHEPILGGTGQISGNFTLQSANDLAILLRSGALPAKLVIIQERTVGATLGADSIAAGELASIIAIIAVVLFMVITYGLFGMFADIALAANLVVLLGLLSFLRATLTLPGIAGIVLTVGMAVDANVLIFERIREEWRAGRSPINAIDTGFKRALGTIFDANITTLIVAAILFCLGSGPVRGFAVTLALGIMTSVFTAFTLTRLLVALWVGRTRPKTIPF